jgi:hypothetical protein
VLISQQEMDLIVKMRRRTMSVPARRGPHNELKVPVKRGGVYRLKVPVPVELYAEQAAAQPTTARAVLDFIARCERPSKDVAITVVSAPVRERVDGEEVWTFAFEKGSHAEVLDRPVYLAKCGDFTLTASRQAVRGDPELMTPFAKDLERARKTALERRISPQQAAVDRIRNDLDTLSRSMKSMKARTKLARLLKALDNVEAQISVENGGTLPSSDRAQCPAPVDADDGTRPIGAESVVSLEPAA